MIYLGQPYSDPNPDVMAWRERIGREAARILTERGEAVFAPIPCTVRLDPERKLTTFEAWRELDLGILAICTEIHVLPLPGWSRSVGLAAEIAFAKERGIPVINCMALLDEAIERLGLPSWRSWGSA